MKIPRVGVLTVSMLAAGILSAVLGSGGPLGAQFASASVRATSSYEPPACHRPKAAPVTATPVAGVPADWTITSFDGTKLRAHWFPVPGANAHRRYPTVFEGPGWGEPGATKAGGDTVGSTSITGLNRSGYNVLTWDPRGFGQSGGTIEVDSAAYEGRDVSRLIDWVATQPGVELDAPGNPRMGMIGGSYGGGIQFVTAAEDCRIDAIVPEIAWHSLTTSLNKAATPKSGWSDLLYAAAPAGHLDPHMTSAFSDEQSNGTIAAADAAWFTSKGPANLVKKITAPTLIIQGTVDNLFTLDEGVANFKAIESQGVPVHMIWFCGGHGICLTNPGDPNYVANETLAWLNRWVKGDRSVRQGPPVDLIDQNGVRYAASNYPVATRYSLGAVGSGTLALTSTGGSGPVTAQSTNSGLTGSLASSITPAAATNAVNVAIDAPSHSALVVGAPRLMVTYRGTVADGTRPTASLPNWSTPPPDSCSATKSPRFGCDSTARPTPPRCRSRSCPRRSGPGSGWSCSWWRRRWPMSNPGSVAQSISPTSRSNCRWRLGSRSAERRLSARAAPSVHRAGLLGESGPTGGAMR